MPVETTGQTPLLVRLLQSLDEQASVQDPLPMDVILVALVLPLMADTVKAQDTDITALISGQKKLNRPKLRVKADSPQPSAAKARAMSDDIMQNTLPRWQSHKHYLSQLHQEAQPADFLNCLSHAAIEHVRISCVEGLFPRSQAASANELFKAVLKDSLAQVGLSFLLSTHVC